MIDALRWFIMRWCVSTSTRHAKAGRVEWAAKYIWWGCIITMYTDISIRWKDGRLLEAK